MLELPVCYIGYGKTGYQHLEDTIRFLRQSLQHLCNIAGDVTNLLHSASDRYKADVSIFIQIKIYLKNN